MIEHVFSKSVSQIARHRELMKIEFVHLTRQLCKFELKINEVKE
jgi:hypothetical protein